MNPVRFVFFLALLAALTSACGTPQAAPLPSPSPSPLPPTAAPMPTATFTLIPTQTNTPEPTAAATSTSTTAPDTLIFRDDFTNGLQPGWEWRFENPARWKFTGDGWLEILGEDPSLLGDGRQSNLLCRESPDGDFQLTVRLYAETQSNFQQAAIFLFQDPDNYVTINRGFCGPCKTGGNGIYMDYKYLGDVNTYMTAYTSPEVFIRFIKQGHPITGYYGFDLDNMKQLGYVGNFLEHFKICLGVSNSDHSGVNSDLLGRFDYVEITRP